MSRPSRYAPEVRARAVRLVFEHAPEYELQWAAIASIATKIGCSAETLRHWVRQVERDEGRRPGLTTEERARRRRIVTGFPSCHADRNAHVSARQNGIASCKP